MKSDRIYLEQIVDSITKIRKFTTGFTYKQFLDDQKTQSAVIMQLALIGELAKRVSRPEYHFLGKIFQVLEIEQFMTIIK